MLRGREKLQQCAELQFLSPNAFRADFLCRWRAVDFLAQVIPDKDAFQRHSWLRSLMARDFGVKHGNDLPDRSGFVGEVCGVAQHFGSGCGMGFQTLGRAEFVEQALLQRDFLRLIYDRFTLLLRNLEVAVLLQFAACRLPPFFPIILDDVGYERLLNLVCSRLSP